jgi:hypothetical protein
MKITLDPVQFVFTPSTNRVSFVPMSGAFKPERLLAVINTTTGKLVYSAASQPAGFGGTFSTTTFPNDTLTYFSSHAGQSASDILQVLYDSETQPQIVSGNVSSYILESGGNTIGGVADPASGDYKLLTASTTYAADGTPILSTVDPMTGGDGLNMHLQSSSYGGQIGNPIPLPNNNNALSVGFLNNSVLVSPAMDPVTNQLIVQSAPAALQNVNLTEVNGTAISLGQSSMGGSIPVVLASDQTAIPITSSSPINVNVTQSVSQDILGVAIGGNRNNQIEIAFNTAPGATLITNTFTGSGSVNITNGHSIYQTGTSTSSTARAVSVQTTTYRPAHEIYAAFTAAFQTPQASCQSRIGLFDASNGFAIGYNGGTFSVFVRNGGVETSTPQSSFNTDTLTGLSTSKFTRNGIPENANFSVSNLFRIRFAWLGSANIFFEVFSPDGEWVLFHNIRQPNTSFNPSIQNPNLPMTLELVKTGGGVTNSTLTTACWGAGTTSAYSPITATLNDNTLAAMTRSVITGVTTGGGGGYVNVKVNPSGALVVENTQSGTASQNIAQYGGVATTLGQKAMTASMPVVLASDQSALPVTTENYITGQQATNATPASTIPGAGTNLLNAAGGTAAIDATGYRTVSVHLIAVGTAAVVNFEHSNDNVNYQNFSVYRLGEVAIASNNQYGNIPLNPAGQYFFTFPVLSRYVRLRLSTAPGAGNSVQCFTRFSTMAWSPPQLNVINATAANLNSTVTGTVNVLQTVPSSLNCTAVVTGATLASSAVGDMVSVSTVASGNSGATGISVLNSHAHSFQVTNVITTGTGSIDAVIQESYDAGSNWVDIFHLDRVTGAGTVRQQIPSLKVNGDRVRYAWTVTGTLTTATMSVTRIPRQVTSGNLRRIYNRTLDPTTLGSSTTALFTEGCEYTDLIVSMAAGGTAPVIQLQGSEDNTNWYNIGTALTATVGATTALSIADGSVPKFCKATVATAGAGSVLNYVAIKAKGAS